MAHLATPQRKVSRELSPEKDEAGYQPLPILLLGIIRTEHKTLFYPFQIVYRILLCLNWIITDHPNKNLVTLYQLYISEI